MNHNPWWRRLGYSLGIVAILAVIAGVVQLWPNDHGGASKSPSGSEETTTSNPGGSDSSDSSTTTAEQPLDPELKEVLTIRSSTIDCPKIVRAAGFKVKKLSDGSTIYWLHDHSTDPVGKGGRLTADALSTPVSALEPKVALDDAILAICQGSLYGGAWMHLFAHLTVGDAKLVDLNPWLEPLAVDPDQINDLALSYARQYNDTRALVLGLDYQVVAEYTAELLTRLRLVGFVAEQSTTNYYLTGGGLVAGSLPEVGINPNQEGLDALVLEADSKTGECLLRVGINLRDKRPEIFSCKTPPPPPSTTVPVTTSPPCTGCGGGTTTTTIPGSTTTTVPCGRKNHRDENGMCVPDLPTGSTTPPPPTTVGQTTTTLSCAYGTHRDPATGLCVSNNAPPEDSTPDPSVPDGNNDGPSPDPDA